MAFKPSAPNPDAAMQYIMDVFRAKPWAKQEQVIRAVFGKKRRTFVRSCHGAGKTYTAAHIALTWLISCPQRTVITTAPTGRQVRELLWKEIRKAYDRAAKYGNPIGGRMPPMAPELRIGHEWLAIGFTSDNPVNLQGWHCAGGTLVIMDEAAGIDLPVWDALQGVMVGEYDRLLAIANPTEASGPFYDGFKDPENERISISAFETPNVISGRNHVLGLVTKAWVDDRRAKWGEDSSLYKSRVLGEFPDDSDDVLIPLSWAERAVTRWHETKWEGPYDVGLDVARYGPDSTVAAIASSQGIKELRRFKKTSTVETAGSAIALMKSDADIQQVRVDADGLGAGVFDILKEELGERAIEMRGGMSPMDKERFLNCRSEWLWNLRERLKPDSRNPIAIPQDERLIAQLTAIKWKTTPKGLIQIEAKDDLRRRVGNSPDELDAIMYALAPLDQVVQDVHIDPSVGYISNPWSV